MEDTAVSEDVSKDVALEGSKVQEVIGLLLAPPKPDDDCQDPIQQVDFPIASDQETMTVNGSTVATISIATSPLNISQVALADAGIPLLEHGDVIQRTLEAHAVQLEDGTTAFVQTLAAADESDSSDVPTKFIDGQAVQLEDGTTAFIHTAPREGLQAVQLEDGTMAYLSQAGAELFDGEASGLGLEQLTSPQISGESHDEKESLGIKVTVGIIENANNRLTSTKAMGEKTFKCPYEGCSRLYTTQHHLKVHERSHTGDRPFKCVISGCGKAFATGYGLKSHTRVHTGETPYRCPEESCNKAFKTSGDLQKHVRTHTGERPFKCPFEGCDRAFTTSNIRKVHIRTHTGERPYVCKEDGCGRAFASATNFKNHIRIHTGEKPYVCTVQGCGKRFTEYSSLYKHHVVHTHSKPYICNLCGKNYRQTSTLAMHKRTVHGIMDGNDDCVLDSSVAAVEDRTLNIKDEEDFEHISKKSRIEFQLGTDIEEGANLVIQGANAQQRSVYAVQVQQDVGLPSSTQQILVVADPSQLVALQQFAQQAQLENVLTQPDIQSDGDVISE